MACQSRGRIQAKFNGGLFTQQWRLKPDPKRNRPHAVQQPDVTLAWNIEPPSRRGDVVQKEWVDAANPD